jgi:hypothetical protein
MNSDRRVETLLKATPERWVVLSEDEQSIVVDAKSFEEAAAAVEEGGMKDAVLVYVPSNWKPRVLF